MRTSRVTFEVVDGLLTFRGWDVIGSHIYRETSEGLCFGHSGVLLRLIDGIPWLHVPPGQHAELLQQDHAFMGKERTPGNFVEVRIHLRE